MTVAVVTIAAGRHDHLRRQRVGLAAGTRRPDVHVIVSMGDEQIVSEYASAARTEVLCLDVPTDGLPLAAARNLGAEHALSLGMEHLVFLDVDVVPDRMLVQRYVAAAADRPGQVLCGPVAYLPPGVTDPARFAEHPFHAARPVPAAGVVEVMADPALFWSLSFALDAAAWRSVGGFHEGYCGYGAEDTDFARSAVRAGVPLGWVGGAAGYHLHHPVSTPPVEHLADILRNGRVFRRRWGSWPMSGWLDEFCRLGLIEHDHGDWVRTRADAGPTN